MEKILIATRNVGKFKELMETLGGLPFKFVSLNDEDIEEDIEESGDTYEANAILKAEHFGRRTKLPAIADDSGLVVEALKDELGVHTRRWGAGAEASDAVWLEHFLNRMAEEKNKKAEFVSVVALYRPGQETLVFRGECGGVILDRPQVEIEPGIPLSCVFLPENKTKVFSAMNKNEKNEISHRGQAVKKCADWILRHMA